MAQQMAMEMEEYDDEYYDYDDEMEVVEDSQGNQQIVFYDQN